ncbi:sigma-70 family RNA polymerase sigma factor [Actinocorallia aurea]
MFRQEAAKIIATVAGVVRDVGIAEELAQDAVVAALEAWPVEGVPARPGAWLTTAARRRAIDLVRRRETYARKLAEVGRSLRDVPPPEPAEPGAIDDDLLRLVFTSCHPLLPATSRAALTLRLLGGLTTGEIARALLTSEAAVSRRITRAKRALAEADVAFETPTGDDRRARLGSVLEVVYLIFNEGYSATSGDDLLRPALCDEAIHLARALVGLLPEEGEVHGLAALLDLQASRFPARTAPDGSPVLLTDQDRTAWDRVLIRRGLDALARAGDGPYSVQAAIAAGHATAPSWETTDWPRITALYDRLAVLVRSPVVELNRAVAVSLSEGPAAALPLVEALAADPSLHDYHLLPAVRADLLARLDRPAEARAAYLHAASLAPHPRDRAFLRSKADALPH